MIAARPLILIPKGFPLYASKPKMLRTIITWTRNARRYIERETAATFDILQPRVLESSLTLVELAKGRLDRGRGGDWKTAIHEIERLMSVRRGDPYCFWVVQLGGGGVAGGNRWRTLRLAGSYRRFVHLGDFGLRFAATGDPDPACVDTFVDMGRTRAGAIRFCSPVQDKTADRAFIHEIGHTLGVDHNPPLDPSLALSDAQKRVVQRTNKDILYPKGSRARAVGTT